MSNAGTAAPPAPKAPAPSKAMAQKLVSRVAERFGIEPEKFLQTLRDTVFHPGWSDGKMNEAFSDSELAVALTLCERYELDPFAKEIYVTRSRGKLLVIVPVDGWIRIMHREKRFRGVAFEDVRGEKGELLAITCKLKVDGLEWPVTVTEYLAECKRPTDPWSSHPHRMLQWKALIQGNRVAFGIAGLMDDDEAERFILGEDRIVDVTPTAAPPRTASYVAPPSTVPVPEELKAPPKTAGKEPVWSSPQLQKKLSKTAQAKAAAEAAAQAPPPAPPEEAQEPPEDTAGPAAGNGAEDTEDVREALYDEWTPLRNTLSPQQMMEVRRRVGIEYINLSCTAPQLRAVIAAAKEVISGS